MRRLLHIHTDEKHIKQPYSTKRRHTHRRKKKENDEEDPGGTLLKLCGLIPQSSPTILSSTGSSAQTLFRDL